VKELATAATASGPAGASGAPEEASAFKPEASWSLFLWRSLAGLSTGLLLGSFLGLSASPLVSTFVGALTALLASLLGLDALPRSGRSARGRAVRLNPRRSSPRPGRVRKPLSSANSASVFFFATGCLGSTVGGLYARSHHWFAPSFQSRISELTHAGFTNAEAKAYVVYQDLGLIASSDSGAVPNTLPPFKAPPSDPPAHGIEIPERNEKRERASGTEVTQAAVRLPPPGVLSASESSICAELQAKRFNDLGTALETYRAYGGKFREIADTVAQMKPEQQPDALVKALGGYCQPGIRH